MSNIKLDYSRLRGRIFSKYMSLSDFGRAINTKTAAISAKLLSGTPFNVSTIFIWAKALDIKDEEFYDYFFIKKVANEQLGKGDE